MWGRARRPLFNVATALSLLLSLASAAMWLRSGYGHVTDTWEFTPLPAGNFYVAAGLREGLLTHRVVESAAGRLVWINYEVLEVNPIPPPFHQVFAGSLAPGQRGRDDHRHPRLLLPPGTVHGRIPGVAEWYLIPQGQRRVQRYVAVTWPFLMLCGAVLPAVREWRRRRRGRRAKAGPAFPVLPTK